MPYITFENKIKAICQAAQLTVSDESIHSLRIKLWNNFFDKSQKHKQEALSKLLTDHSYVLNNFPIITALIHYLKETEQVELKELFLGSDITDYIDDDLVFTESLTQLEDILGMDFFFQPPAIQHLRLMNLSNHRDFFSHHLVLISKLFTRLHDESVLIPSLFKYSEFADGLLKSPHVGKKYSKDELEELFTQTKYDTELHEISRHTNIHHKIEPCSLFVAPPPFNSPDQLAITRESQSAYVLVGHQLYYQSKAEYQLATKNNHPNKNRFVLVKEFHDGELMPFLRILDTPAQITKVCEQLSGTQLALITANTGHSQKIIYFSNESNAEKIVACIPPEAIDRFNQSIEIERRTGFTPNSKLISKELQTILFLENMASYMRIYPDEANREPLVIELADLIGEDFFSLDTFYQLERLEKVFQIKPRLAEVLFDLESLIGRSFENWLIPEPKKLQKGMQEEMRNYDREFFNTTTLHDALETKRDPNLSPTPTASSASSSSSNSPRSVLITEGLFSPKKKSDKADRSPRKVSFSPTV